MDGSLLVWRLNPKNIGANIASPHTRMWPKDWGRRSREASGRGLQWGYQWSIVDSKVPGQQK